MSLVSRVGALVVGILTLGGTGVVGAQSSAPPRAPTEVHREGAYGGVEPGAAEDAERERRRRCRGGRRATPLTWIGFQPQAGGARVFAQLCGEVEYDQELVDGKLVVRLFGARHGSRNARRPLDTRFFDTPVARVTSRRFRSRNPRRRGVKLVITFKDPAAAQPASATLKTEQDGYTYLYLDFGPV